MKDIFKYSLFMLAMGLTTAPYSSQALGAIRAHTPGLNNVNDENLDNQNPNVWVMEGEMEEDEDEVAEPENFIPVVTFTNPTDKIFSVITEDADGSNHEQHQSIEPHGERTFRFNPDTNRLVIFSFEYMRNGRKHELRYTFCLKNLVPNSTLSIRQGEKFNTANRVEAQNNGNDPVARRLF